MTREEATKRYIGDSQYAAESIKTGRLVAKTCKCGCDTGWRFVTRQRLDEIVHAAGERAKEDELKGEDR